MESTAITLSFTKVRARQAQRAAETLATSLEKLKRGVENGDVSPADWALIQTLMAQAEDTAVALYGVVANVESRQKAAEAAAAEAERARREAAATDQEQALVRVLEGYAEDAASDEIGTGYGCYLILGPRLGLPEPAYVVRTDHSPRFNVAGVETFETAQAGWDRFNGLCASD